MLSKVRAARLDKGLTQMEVVAQCANILSQYRLSVIERGVPPRGDEAAAISVVLGVPAKDLFE